MLQKLYSVHNETCFVKMLYKKINPLKHKDGGKCKSNDGKISRTFFLHKFLCTNTIVQSAIHLAHRDLQNLSFLKVYVCTKREFSQ